MSQYNCYASKGLCVIRGARLGADCVPVAGVTGGFASSGIISFNATANKETGQEFQMKDGCGNIVHYTRDRDRTKNLDVSFDLTSFDFEALELMTGGSLIMDTEVSPKVVGINDPALDATGYYGVYLELWTQTIVGSDVCGSGDAGAFQWFRTVFPRVLLSRDDTDYQNDITGVKLSGYAFPNPVVSDGGAFNDIEVTGIDHDAPRYIFGDPDGPPSTVCGYVTVPVQASS
jgi:hypothetical protein